MSRAQSLIGPSRVLPQGLFDLLRQIVLFCGAYYLYRLVRGLVDGDAAAAFDNARTLVDIERALGLFFEPGLQAWALGQSWLIDASNWMYVNSHFTITTVFLAWLYLARNPFFYFVRNMFMVAMGLALVGYLAYPTAPPRFMPEWGFTDTVEQFVGQAGSNAAHVFYNPFAAVPSMHVAFALMIAATAVRLVKPKPLKVLWATYPLIVTVVVVVTANHFWLDVALGVVVALLSAAAAQSALARARPEAWAFARPGASEAAA